MIYIVIPTYKRVKKLKRCIESLQRSTFKDWRLVIVADNMDVDSVIYGNSIVDDRLAEVMVQPEHRFVIGAWNRFWDEYKDKEFEGMLGLCDDVELHPDSLQKAIECFRTNYPDTDGVVGFKQECTGRPDYTFKWFGQTIIGKKFASRYPNFQVHCPDYKHFYQDEEMYVFAESMKKFTCCPEALLIHYHPGFVEKELDETHDIIRKSKVSPKNRDITTFNLRHSKNLLWGQSFELVNK